VGVPPDTCAGGRLPYGVAVAAGRGTAREAAQQVYREAGGDANVFDVLGKSCRAIGLADCGIADAEQVDTFS
jgi:hypothetical protein